MFARQMRRLNLTKCEESCNLYFRNPNGLRFMSRNEMSDTNEEEEKPRRSLKQWRPHYDTKHKLATKLKIFDRRERPSTDFLVRMNAPWDVSRSGLERWWRTKQQDLAVYDQRFVKERHEILGSNLAAAHFLVHRGAKIKFFGHDNWVERDGDNNYSLPGKYEPDYLVEAIDANGIDLYYNGLSNMRYLYDLKFLSLKGCKTIDDWCMDRISSLLPRLEFLDVSNCKKVSERGLEALYRMHTLKTMIVTNHSGSAALELTCVMLEECNPNLKCYIRSPEPEPKSEKSKD